MIVDYPLLGKYIYMHYANYTGYTDYTHLPYLYTPYIHPVTFSIYDASIPTYCITLHCALRAQLHTTTDKTAANSTTPCYSPYSLPSLITIVIYEA